MSKPSYNRLANINNRFQTDRHKVLCLCSAGLLRSPTAANVLHHEFGFNTRAAGVSVDYALILADEVLLRWADEIVCVEQSVADTVKFWIAGNLKNPEDVVEKITTLSIPDQYEWNDPELRALIKEQYLATVDARSAKVNRNNFAGEW